MNSLALVITERNMQDLHLYMWATPNSRRVSVLFEELGLSYAVNPVNIRAGEQFTSEVVTLNPYAKVPIVVWHENGVRRVLFESGAILTSFAERNEQFFPTARNERDKVLVWLMVALTSIGPLTGQAHHWTTLAEEKPAAALKHHVDLIERVYLLLNARLAEREFLANQYSIADIAAYPWIAVSDWTTLSLGDYPNLERWYGRISARPAVARGMALPSLRKPTN